jgi:ribonuclease VapC
VNKCVLDASAILAALLKEPGHEFLTDEVLGAAVASTVNLAEVQAFLVKQGADPAEAWKRAIVPVSQVIPFSSEQARVAGTLVSETRIFGLSLGDRACLALALELNAVVYTADKAWKKLNIGIPIRVIR